MHKAGRVLGRCCPTRRSYVLGGIRRSPTHQVGSFHPTLLKSLLKACPQRSLRSGYAVSPCEHPPLPHSHKRQGGDRTDTGLKQSQGEECSGHHVQDRSWVTTPPALQWHSHVMLAMWRGRPKTQGQPQHSQTLGMPAKSGSQATAPNTSNMSVFYWRLGLGSSSARACKNLCFCPRGPFPTSISV